MAHTHEIQDQDTIFVIDPKTRNISSSSSKIVLMQNDHNSEIFTFSIPRFVEGHDMNLCNKIEVHYTNLNKRTREESSDIYPVTDQKVEEDNLIFTWLISGKATKYPGTLSFSIKFGCIEEDSTYSYIWHTGIFKNVTISDEITNTESVEEEYSDVLENWKNQLIELGTDYNNISNAPIKYLKSPDENGNNIVIRDLDSGTYVLDGVFYLFKTDTSSQAAVFKYGFPCVISKTDSKTYVQVLYPPNNTVQYVEITDDSFYQNNTRLNLLQIVNSDWNQNDETQADYVKNRTHYCSEELLKTTWDGNIDGKTVAYYNGYEIDSDPTYKFYKISDKTFEFIETTSSEGYTVYRPKEDIYMNDILIDGHHLYLYKIMLEATEGMYRIGSSDGTYRNNLVFITNPNSVGGRAGQLSDNKNYLFPEPGIYASGKSSNVGINVSWYYTIFHQLDPRFLPESALPLGISGVSEGYVPVISSVDSDGKPTSYDAFDIVSGIMDFGDELYYDAITLGLQSATVGQIAKIKAVDSNGIPTEWEAVDMASGGVGIQSVVQTTTSAEDGGTNVVTVTKTDGTTSTFEVRNGSKGSSPEKGIDYWTAADQQAIVDDVLAALPTWEGGSY